MKTLQAGLMALITATAAILPAAAQTATPAPAAAGVWTEKELNETTWTIKLGSGTIECLFREGGHVTSRKGRGMNETDIRKWELRDGGRKIAIAFRTGGVRQDNWRVYDYKDARSGTRSGVYGAVDLIRVK